MTSYGKSTVGGLLFYAVLIDSIHDYADIEHLINGMTIKKAIQYIFSYRLPYK